MSAGLSACSCTSVGCTSSVLFTISDGDGNPVTTFTATVTAEGRTIVATCDGVSDGLEFQCENDGTLFVSDIADTQPDLQVEVSDPQGRSFSGTVMPSYATDDNFNGPGCGSCTSGSVAITLD